MTTFTDRQLGIVGNAAFKVPVKAASSANHALTGEQTVGGTACVTGDRVLLKNQTTGSENGIWVVDTGAWSRAKDFNGTHDIVKGTLIALEDGTAYYRVATDNPIVIGTDSLSFLLATPTDAASVGFVQSGSGAVARTAESKMRDSLSVYDYMTDAQRADVEAGTMLVDVTDAVQDAIADAALQRVAELEFPGKAYLLSGQAVEGTALPTGLRFRATGVRGGSNTVSGVVFKYTGSGYCWDIRNPNNTSGLHRGSWEWSGFTFNCTHNDGGMFSINFLDSDGNEYTPTNDNTTPEFVLYSRWRSCMFWGAGGGASQTGHGIRACKTFHIETDSQCYFRGWLRGVYLKGCDNNKIDGRFELNRRHIQIEASNTFGNDTLIVSRFIGLVSSSGGEDAYQIYDTGGRTTILAPDMESTTVASAHFYFNGLRTTVINPDFDNFSTPLWELGADAREISVVCPKLGSAVTKTPTYATATSYDWMNTKMFYGVTVTDPDIHTKRTLPLHPRQRIVGDPVFNEDVSAWYPAINVNSNKNGLNQKSFFCGPIEYRGRSGSVGFNAIDGIVADTDGFMGYAIRLTTTHLSGFLFNLRVGQHVNEGDTIRVTIDYRMEDTPGTGTLRRQLLKNNSSIGGTDAALTNSTSYAKAVFQYTLSGFAATNRIGAAVYCANADEKLLVRGITIDVLDPIDTISADNGDAAATLTVGASSGTQLWSTELTADRAVTLSTMNAYSGAKFRIVRPAVGAFNLNVGTGPLSALAAGEWCEVEYSGSAWVLTAFGALS